MGLENGGVADQKGLNLAPEILDFDIPLSCATFAAHGLSPDELWEIVKSQDTATIERDGGIDAIVRSLG
jgi:hypothetical protein